MISARCVSTVFTLRFRRRAIFDLTGTELAERPPHRQGGFDRRAEAAQLPFEDAVLGAGLEAGHERRLVQRACDDDQRRGRPDRSHQLQRGARVELGQRVIGENHVRGEFLQRPGERSQRRCRRARAPVAPARRPPRCPRAAGCEELPWCAARYTMRQVGTIGERPRLQLRFHRSAMTAAQKGKAWDQSAVGVGVRSHPPDLQRLYPRPCVLPLSLRFRPSRPGATRDSLGARWRRTGGAAIRENPEVPPAKP